jgi:hypothetical protein
MRIYQDAYCTLNVDGLTETPEPLVLIATCRRCGLELSRTTIPVDETSPYRTLFRTHPNALADLVREQATTDAETVLAHICLARFEEDRT